MAEREGERSLTVRQNAPKHFERGARDEARRADIAPRLFPLIPPQHQIASCKYESPNAKAPGLFWFMAERDVCERTLAVRQLATKHFERGARDEARRADIAPRLFPLIPPQHKNAPCKCENMRVLLYGGEGGRKTLAVRQLATKQVEPAAPCFPILLSLSKEARRADIAPRLFPLIPSNIRQPLLLNNLHSLIVKTLHISIPIILRQACLAF